VALRHVAEPLLERFPLLPFDVGTPELVARLAGEAAEPFVVEFLQGRCHDPALGEEVCLGQVQQARQQLAPRQVAGGAEQNDDMRRQGRHGRGGRRTARGGLSGDLCHRRVGIGGNLRAGLSRGLGQRV
jgi:hypothetical protein